VAVQEETVNAVSERAFDSTVAETPLSRDLSPATGGQTGDSDLSLVKAYNGWMFGGPASIQYWRAYDQLVAYSRSTDAEHLAAWRAARRTDAVGVWHETYRVTAGRWETIYGSMKDVACSVQSVATRSCARAPHRLGSAISKATVRPLTHPRASLVPDPNG
jgi:hypothetical protein